MAEDWLDVAPTREIAPEERRIVPLDDVDVLVLNVEGHYYALEDMCSHDRFPLSDGEVEGEVITCALHGAKFCIRSGEALCAPAYAPVHVFPVRVENGMVQIRDDRWD
jgi:3-phenylpropionate/trans-cinnamate dioxygenase ferredoxin subunit